MYLAHNVEISAALTMRYAAAVIFVAHEALSPSAVQHECWWHQKLDTLQALLQLMHLKTLLDWWQL